MSPPLAKATYSLLSLCFMNAIKPLSRSCVLVPSPLYFFRKKRRLHIKEAAFPLHVAESLPDVLPYPGQEDLDPRVDAGGVVGGAVQAAAHDANLEKRESSTEERSSLGNSFIRHCPPRLSVCFFSNYCFWDTAAAPARRGRKSLFAPRFFVACATTHSNRGECRAFRPRRRQSKPSFPPWNKSRKPSEASIERIVQTDPTPPYLKGHLFAVASFAVSDAAAGVLLLGASQFHRTYRYFTQDFEIVA